MLDIFNEDPFTIVSMTASINSPTDKPTRIARMGLFGEEGISTTTAAIEFSEEQFKLVPDSPRGGVPEPVGPDKSKILSLKVPHLPQWGTVLADSVQNIRSFGSETQLQTVENVVNKRLAKMRTQLDLTIEYMRIGAIKGKILDANGVRVLHDLFAIFDVVQQTHTMNLDTTTTNVIAKCIEITGKIEDALGGLTYDHIHAFCGASFFAKLIAHTTVKETFMNWQRAQSYLEEDRRFTGVLIGGIMWEQYRGKVGTIDFIESTKAHVFPVGVPEMFVNYFAPADYAETVNTIGLPYYAKQEPMRMNKGIDIEAQSNPLPINTRPRAVILVSEHT